MQSPTQESRAVLSFTYRLFLDDHFPDDGESFAPLPTFSPQPERLTKSTDSLNEILTRASVTSEGTKKCSLGNKLYGNAIENVLFADKLGSDLSDVDTQIGENTFDGNGKKRDHKKTFKSDSEAEFDNKRRLLGPAKERLSLETKSGFSIWSVMSPNLGLDQEFDKAGLGPPHRSAKINTDRLRVAFRKRHFLRVTQQLSNLLSRKRSPSQKAPISV